MQGRGAIFVRSIDVRSCNQKALDCLHLPERVPGGAGYVTVGGVMQWAALAMVFSRVCVGASGKQKSNYFNPIAGRSQMKGGISDVKPVKDFGIVEPRFRDEAGCESGLRLEQLLHRCTIIINYGLKDCLHRRWNMLILAGEKSEKMLVEMSGFEERSLDRH